MDYRCTTKIIQMTDTLKIPRAAIQYSNQEPSNRHDNIAKMHKFLVKSTTVDSLPGADNNFEVFSNDLKQDQPNDQEPRHSTFTGKSLTAANLARLALMHDTPSKTARPTADSEYTITVDSMVTANNDKPKETDAASNASSTHFTMVNGFGGSRNKQPTKPVCCCNHITAVIVSMTILLMFIIFGVIIFAEYPRMMAEIKQ